MTTDDIEALQEKIKYAREYIQQVQKRRALIAGIMGGLPGTVQTEVVFPDVDIAHVYQCVPSGRRMGEPVVYRLSFGESLKWVGVSHRWGLKAADITVEQMNEGELS